MKEMLLVNRIRRRKNYKIGAIVMNANPFTLGHRYLAEYAASKVDYLYIFVLEEDKSEISYDDRLKMVYLGTKDIKNITVTSGGKAVISDVTFPEYFMKKELQDVSINAFKDIESFALYVAPLFSINVRFFGEEPLDNVTRQYNEQMKKYLPQYFIETEEIPRKEDEGGCISASRVRKLLAEGNIERIVGLVPQSTYKYLLKHNIDKKCS